MRVGILGHKMGWHIAVLQRAFARRGAAADRDAAGVVIVDRIQG